MRVSDDQTREQVIALAGMFQATHLVQQVARTGSLMPSPFVSSIESLFRFDPDSAIDVYGGVDGVADGLRVLLRVLARERGDDDVELTRYASSLMHLERRLAREPNSLAAIRRGLDRAHQQGRETSPTSEDVIEELARVYASTISTIGPRILVHGKPECLNRKENADRIRALLLSGMRAAVLWRQVGGRRLGLLLGRGKLARAAKTLLNEAGGG